MSPWNYRVIHKYHEEDETHTYHIHEVFYDENGSIEMWTESAVKPFGETPSELREDIRYFIKAFQKPILIEKIKDGKKILVPDEESSEINQTHYSEFLDRSWVAIDYIYQFLGCHPLLRKDKKLRDIYTKAEKVLSDLYHEAGKMEYGSEQNRSYQEDEPDGESDAV